MKTGIGRRRVQRGHKHRAIAIGLAMLIGTVALVADRPWAAAESGHTALTWRPDASTPRLKWARLRGLPPLSISSFTTAGGKLLLADRVASRVIQASPAGNGDWSVDAIVADRPAIERPISIATTPDDNVVVFDADHGVHLLSRAHRGVQSFTAAVPCGLNEAQLTIGDNGALWLSGRCPVNGGDTVAAVLLSSTDGGRRFVAVAALPLFGRDGSWGSMLFARQFLLAAGDSVMFGTGVTGCVRVARLTALDSLRRDCSLAAPRYGAPEPADFAAVRAERVRMGMTHAKATEWPELMPVFMSRVMTPAGIALVRLVTGDSVQIELSGATASVPLLVAPLNGFRGCVGSDCLWARNVGAEMLIRLVHVPDLLVAANARRRVAASDPAPGEACGRRSEDTLRYEEIINADGLVQRGVAGDRLARSDTARIEYAQAGSSLVASYTPANSQGADRPGGRGPASFVFAGGDCGTGAATLQSSNRDDGSELPYHLDGLLVRIPPETRLALGESWADTITRSDSMLQRRRTSVLVRQFRIARDTSVGGTRALIVSIESQGTVLDVEKIGGKSMTLIIASSSRGNAVLSQSSDQMTARSDSTDFRVTASFGDASMPEQRVASVRTLRLLNQRTPQP